MATLAWCSPLLANADTTTTVYTYNADGALTSITETTEGRSGSRTTYFTWDNFDAATGTPTAANGNLIGIGTMEGGDSIQSLGYDNLDRLVRVTNPQDDTAALYEYHPDELLAASLNAKAPSSDGLQHYYDESRYPQVTNLYDRHTGELSSRRHRIRYLEDGTEQMLVRHRKDVDGVYNLGDQTMSGYAYDPYGASLEQELTGAPPAGPLYSVRNNPYRYSNELRDPVSGADYLRARWYLPGHQTFLQRDPAPNLNRYGYANGNPISNYDPSGRNAKAFLKGLEQGLISGASLGIEPLVAVGLSEGRSFWQARNLGNNLLQIGLTLASAATALVGTMAAYNSAWALMVEANKLASTIGFGRSALYMVQHPGSVSASAGNVLGGAIGGFASTRLLEGVPSLFRAAVRRWNNPQFDLDSIREDMNERVRNAMANNTPRPTCGHFCAAAYDRRANESRLYDQIMTRGIVDARGRLGTSLEHHFQDLFRAAPMARNPGAVTEMSFTQALEGAQRVQGEFFAITGRTADGEMHGWFLHVHERFPDGYQLWERNGGLNNTPWRSSAGYRPMPNGRFRLYNLQPPAPAALPDVN